MPGWVGSTRGAATSTPAWRKTRATILERDAGICYLCGQPGADRVDHKTPVYLGGTDDPENLGAVHDSVFPHCHRSKSGREGAAARPRLNREPERHPGLLDASQGRRTHRRRSEGQA